MAGFLLGILVALMLLCLLAPTESLRWWATQSAAESDARTEKVRRALAARTDEDPRRSYLIFVSGVGAVDPTPSIAGERPLLDSLRRHLADVAIVDHIYPYAMENRSLIEQRINARWWRFMSQHTRRSRIAPLARWLINMRNTLQVAVSMDSRYGPLYSLGIANVMWDELLKAGYRPGSRTPIVLLSWSGGAKITLGSAWYLAATGAPFYLVSVGGGMADDPGLEKVTHLWHLTGTKDWVQATACIFPGRWPFRRRSDWSRAKAQGRLGVISLGPMRHLGLGSYLSAGGVMPDGRTARQTTVDTICELLFSHDLATPAQEGSRRSDPPLSGPASSGPASPGPVAAEPLGHAPPRLDPGIGSAETT